MRKRLVIGLVMLNLLLGAALVLGPLSAQILPMSSLRDCCQSRTCCSSCCWLVSDCDTDGDCEAN